MPSLVLYTNLPAKAIPESFAEEMTEIMHKQLGKPKKFIAVHIIPDQHMTWEGTREPCALCTLSCIGKIGTEENKDHSVVFTEKINRDLKIAPNRMYITFANMNGDNVGWNGKTFAKV